MPRRPALWLLLAALSACDAPPPKVQEKAAAVIPLSKAIPLSKDQVDALSAQCEKLSREQLRRAGKSGAEIASHYNVKMNVCFYVLTEASSGTLKKMLYDVNGAELYGEFLGPGTVDSPAAERPKTCRIESFYCASAREWDVLVEPYMQE